MKRPSLNALRALEATVRLSSMSAAADELSVTHGAVSRHIRSLEDMFGMPLLLRGARSVQATPEGARNRAYRGGRCNPGTNSPCTSLGRPPVRVRFAGRHGAGQFGPPHGRCTKSPEMRVRSREVTDGIVSTAPECRGASSPRALDPLQKLEPNVKERPATFKRSHPSFSGMVRPSTHGRKNSSKWLKTGC